MLAVLYKQHGFSLVELTIALVISSLLLMFGVPAFSDWIQNTQIRGAAESVLNGLQLARSEAVSRNAQVRFSLTNAAGTLEWNVGCINVTANCPATIQNHSAAEGGGLARVGVDTNAIGYPIPASLFSTAISAGTGLPAGVTFDGLGRPLMANIGTDLTWLNVVNVSNAHARRMVVMINTGGEARMCDPALALDANPQGCS